MITAATVIKGLDIKSALMRVNGKEELYTRLLRLFLKGEMLDALRSGLNDGNIKDAAFAAHAIKGDAANLSVTELHTAAGELEQSLKASAAVSEEHMEMLKVIEEKYCEMRELCAQYLEA